MKIFIYFTFVIGLTLAEPPSYRQQYQRDRQTYYVAKQAEQQPEAEEPVDDTPAESPYQPSGWKPDGQQFDLPQKQQQSPPKQYGAPAEAPYPSSGRKPDGRQFELPQKQYNPPVATHPRQFGVSQQQYKGQQQLYSTPQQQYNLPQSNYGVPVDQYGVPSTESSTDDYDESTTLSPESQDGSVDSVNELDDAGEQRQSGQYFIALPDGRLQRIQYISSQDMEAMKYFAKIRAENVEPLRGPIYAYQPLQKLQFAPSQLEVQALSETLAPATATEAHENNRNQKIVKASASSLSSEKFEIQPLAAELPGSPLSTSYTTYMANYQVPTAEQRYFITF